MVDEVILHIGLHKTGSTAIQQSIYQLTDGVTRTIRFQEENHSIPMFTVFSEKRFKYNIWTAIGTDPKEIEQKRKQYLKILHRELTDKEYTRLIISGEDISVLQDHEKTEMIKFFHEKGIKVNIVSYVRDPASWMVSMTQQTIKVGRFNGVVKGPNYKKKLEPFLQLLPSENTSVYSFENVINGYGSVVKHFGSLLNMSLPDVKAANSTLTPLQMALAYYLNKVPLQILGDKTRYQMREQILQKIMLLDSEDEHDRKLKPEYLASLFPDGMETDCKWLSDNFGINYPVPTKTLSTSLEDYLNGLLMRNLHKIEKFFAYFDVKYNPRLNFELNFLEVYFSEFQQKIMRSFNAETYLILNPDVRAANVNPYEHYLRHGIHEGRRVE
jgi:hypothetical protein